MKKTTTILIFSAIAVFSASQVTQARPPQPAPLQPANQEITDFTEGLNDPDNPGYEERKDDGEYATLPVYGEQDEMPDDSGVVPDIIPNTDSGGVDMFSIMMTILVFGLSAGAAYTYYWYRHKNQK
jgi:hypothetical protein